MLWVLGGFDLGRCCFVVVCCLLRVVLFCFVCCYFGFAVCGLVLYLHCSQAVCVLWLGRCFGFAFVYLVDLLLCQFGFGFRLGCDFGLGDGWFGIGGMLFCG